MTPKIKLALPSKGRLQQDALELLQACDLHISKNNLRQYIAQIPNIPQLEVWFQRPADIVRHVRDGNVDLGIAGLDTLAEYRGEPDQITLIHEALEFGRCNLEVVVPEAWKDVNSLADLAQKATNAPTPLRIVSKFERVATRFLRENNISPVRHLHADGALEAAPNMGTADFIVDLVQTGLTLQENRLKRINGGTILESQAAFFGNTQALKQKADTFAITCQILELFEAHLRAKRHYNLIANVRGPSAEAVAEKLHQQSELSGLQGPTISPVYSKTPQKNGWYAISLVVHKSKLHRAIQQIRAVGGSGVVVLPATFIFEEEPERLRRLQVELKL